MIYLLARTTLHVARASLRDSGFHTRDISSRCCLYGTRVIISWNVSSGLHTRQSLIDSTRETSVLVLSEFAGPIRLKILECFRRCIWNLYFLLCRRLVGNVVCANWLGARMTSDGVVFGDFFEDATQRGGRKETMDKSRNRILSGASERTNCGRESDNDSTPREPTDASTVVEQIVMEGRVVEHKKHIQLGPSDEREYQRTRGLALCGLQ